MLISTSKNFIFVHIPKTAGLSVTKLLQPYALDAQRTTFRRFTSHLPIQEDLSKTYFRVHDKSYWIKRKVGAEKYDAMHSFTVVRNPYDLAVSYYTYLRKVSSNRRHRDALKWTFGEYLTYLQRKNTYSPRDQTSWVVGSKNQLIVDTILRFENLSVDFSALAENLGLPGETILPHINRSAHKPYQEYYGESEKAAIAKLYRRDIERFGYTF